MAISNPCFMASKIVSFSGEETTFLLPASTSNIAQASFFHCLVDLMDWLYHSAILL